MGTVALEKTGRIARIVIDNPGSRNGLTGEMARQITDHVLACSGDPDVRAIVLTGRGAHFCSGADLTSGAALLGANDADLIKHIDEDMHGPVRALVDSPKPTLAVIRGACVGIGLSYALACDLRLAAADAKMGLVFARIGLLPDGGSSYTLPRLVGLGRALELAMLAPSFNGEEAADWGVVNRSVPEPELDALANDWAERLSAGPPIAYRGLKQNYRLGLSSASLDEVLTRESKAQVACLRSQDALRGVQAFFTKTKAQFEGN